MTDTELLRAAENLIAAFGDRISLDSERVTALVGNDPHLASRCLLFLRERDEILVAADERSVFHRGRLLAAVAGTLRGDGPATAAAVAATLTVPVPVTCEALGWLSREGSVEAVVREDRTFYRAR